MDAATLWSRHRAGEHGARCALIEIYADLATRIARSMRVRTSALAERDDLESVAMVGLIQAIDRFDPDRGVPFEAFAALRIRGAIVDELRVFDDLTRAERDRVLEQDGPDQRTVSLDALLAAGGDRWVADAGLDQRFDEEDLHSRVGRAIESLSSRQRELIAHRYGTAKTLRDAARRMGISEARASQLHARALDNLRRTLVPAAAA